MRCQRHHFYRSHCISGWKLHCFQRVTWRQGEISKWNCWHAAMRNFKTEKNSRLRKLKYSTFGSKVQRGMFGKPGWKFRKWKVSCSVQLNAQQNAVDSWASTRTCKSIISCTTLYHMTWVAMLVHMSLSAFTSQHSNPLTRQTGLLDSAVFERPTYMHTDTSFTHHIIGLC